MRTLVFLSVLLSGCDADEPKETTPVTEDTGEDIPPDTDTDEPETAPVDSDGDGYTEDVDCDDAVDTIHPGAEEHCDGVDEDCDGEVDEDAVDVVEWYTDSDGDGYGDDSTLQSGCEVPSDGVSIGGDCDDAQADISPDAEEIPANDVDEDCDGTADPAGPVTATADCTLNEHVFETGEATQLYVVGVYEPEPTDGSPISVHVEPEQPAVLFLNSYDPVEWVVSEAVSGTIQEIWYASYEGSTVTAPASIPVSQAAYHGSAYDWDDYDTRDVVAEAERVAGVGMASFHGCSSMSSITIEAAAGYPSYPEYPDCSTTPTSSGPSSGPDPSALSSLTSCTSILAESTYCLGTDSTGTRLIGLESGDSCQVTNNGLSAYTLTWHDEYLYACGNYGQLMRLDLTSGLIEKSYVYCGSVVSYDGALLANPDFVHGVPSFTDVYDAWEDVQCLGPTSVLSGYGDSTERQTAYDGMLYTAWHSTDEIEVYSLPSFSLSHSITMEDYDGWIYGLSVPDADQLVINARGTELIVHALDDGAELDRLTPPYSLTGLACHTP